jgi:hypothetical protein
MVRLDDVLSGLLRAAGTGAGAGAGAE